ncbi:MAG: hypothetical protein ACLFUB_11090 [Cyclobacteriaceae bacterium]
MSNIILFSGTAAIQLPFSFTEDRLPGDRLPGDRLPGENDDQLSKLTIVFLW